MGLREYLQEGITNRILGSPDEVHTLVPSPINLGSKFKMVEMIGNKEFLITESQFDSLQANHKHGTRPYNFVRLTDGYVQIYLKEL